MFRAFFLAIVAVALAGCDAPVERFEPNKVYALTLDRSLSTPADAALDDAAQVVEQLFGTPDTPRWPSQWLDDRSLAALVSSQRLARAAGAVSSDREGVNQGLYRKHCVHCHGINGGGAGPASLLQNPYPRDFRHGVFKWKSTERAAKPTRHDLRSLLHRGVADTAMPSFRLLEEEDIEALLDYVIYLSVRGEVERRLAAAAVIELGYEETAPEPPWRLVSIDDSEAGQLVRETIDRVARSWAEAEEQVVEVPDETELHGEELRASIERGKDIFHGQIASCVGCHGPAGNGQAVTLDYDDWAKEYSTRIGLTPTDPQAMRPFRDAGALPPRQSRPRKLAGGVFRGAGDGPAIFRHISQGIAGTPMPSVDITTAGTGIGLTPQQAWDLVRYVRSLGKHSDDHE